MVGHCESKSSGNKIGSPLKIMIPVIGSQSEIKECKQFIDVELESIIRTKLN